MLTTNNGWGHSSLHATLVLLTALVLTMVPRRGGAFHCPILQCSCFYNGRETVKIACPPEHHGVQYTVTHHIVQGELNIDCLEPIEYRPAMFRSFNFSNIVHIQFSRCPLPANGTTFANILFGFHPRMINFNRNDQEVALDATLFANLNGLETLDLDENGFVDVLLMENEHQTMQDMVADWSTLEGLSLANNQLTQVPQSLLRVTLNLHGLTLTDNKIESLEEDEFDNLAHLQILKLDQNEIKSVASNVLKPLKSLKLLWLNGNRIRVLSPVLLYNLTHLQFLDMSDNEVERVPTQFLKDNIHLKAFKMSRNHHLRDLPPDLLWSTTSLEELDISENNISAIPELLFQNTVVLHKLNLRRNMITTLPSGLFVNTSRLSVINLAKNRLVSLTSGIFDAVIHLNELNLSHNSIKEIRSNTFATLGELLVLDLSHNLLENIDSRAFEVMTNLRFLDLGHNFLVFVDHIPPFIVPLNVDVLNMSNNMITSLSLGWTQSGRLRHFNVSYNQIKYVLVKVSHVAQGLMSTIDLRHNLVNTVQVMDDSVSIEDILILDESTNGTLTDAAMTAPEIHPEINVLLGDNPIACDCNLLSFLVHLSNVERLNQSFLRFADAQTLVCTTPHEFVDRPVLSILSEELYCPVYEKCEEGCNCIQKAVNRSVMVDCRQRSLSSPPSRVPPNTTVLHLEGNNVTTLQFLSKPLWSNLTELYVSDNSLTVVDLPESMPKNLNVIRLDNNRLQYLPEWFIEGLESRGNTTVLWLGNNPWVCDCRNVPFQRWLARNWRSVEDHTDIICKVKKVDRRGHTYVHVHLNRMVLVTCKPTRTSNKTSVILAASLILTLTGVLVLGSKLVFKHFFKMKLFLVGFFVKRPTRKTSIESSA